MCILLLAPYGSMYVRLVRLAGSESKCISVSKLRGTTTPQTISSFSYFSVDLCVFSHKESVSEAVEGGGARRSQVPSCEPAGWQPICGVAFHWAGRRWRHWVPALQIDAPRLHSCKDIASENEEGSSGGNHPLIC